MLALSSSMLALLNNLLALLPSMLAMVWVGYGLDLVFERRPETTSKARFIKEAGHPESKVVNLPKQGRENLQSKVLNLTTLLSEGHDLAFGGSRPCFRAFQSKVLNLTTLLSKGHDLAFGGSRPCFRAARPCFRAGHDLAFGRHDLAFGRHDLALGGLRPCFGHSNARSWRLNLKA